MTSGKCVICSADLPVGRYREGRRKYCSAACKARNAHYKRTGKNRAQSKVCTGCGSAFSIADVRNPDGKLKRSDTKWCDSCRPTNNPLNAMTRRLFYRYGVTLDQYQKAAETGCEICGRTDVKMHVDHDHDCCPSGYTCGNCVRGFLCGSCNRAIGLLNEDPNLLLSAAAYVFKSQDVLGGAPSRS